MSKINYEPIKIGIFKNDEEDYNAVVIYWTENERHTTVWHYGFKILDKQLTKSEWENVRDEKGLILVDIQTAEFPVS